MPETKRKKLFAVAAAAILMAVAVGISYGLRGPTSNLGNGSQKKYPIPPPNVAVAARSGEEEETTIAISPVDPDTMVVGANDCNTPKGGVWCGYYTTHDRGKSWKQTLIGGYPGGPSNALSGFNSLCDPSVVADSKGNFFYSGLGYNIYSIQGHRFTASDRCVWVAKSTDNGDSFDQVIIAWRSPTTVFHADDQPRIAVDPVNGNVYLDWVIGTRSVTDSVMFSRSTDDGATWSTPYKINKLRTDPLGFATSMVVDGKSVVHLVYERLTTGADYRGTGAICYARSTDQGRSFSTPIVIDSFNYLVGNLPNSNYRVGQDLCIAADMSSSGNPGKLYVTCPQNTPSDMDIYLYSSSDGGTTWDGPVRVNNDTEGNGEDQFFSSVAVSSEGWVHVGFYDRRSDPNNTFVEYWWAISFDGGQSFPINIPLSNTSFDGNDGAMGGGAPFIGDYTTIAADNETVAAVWADTRNATPDAGQVDVYGAVVPYKELLRTNKFGNLTIPWPAAGTP